MNNLPNLSEWHEVPRGATIPKGIRWAVLYSDGDFNVYAFTVDTNDYAPETKFYTAEPIERSLAQVIESAYNNYGDWEYTARAARDFLTPKVPGAEYVIDGDNDKWVLNDKGTYDYLYATDSLYQNKTLDYIRDNFGIQED